MSFLVLKNATLIDGTGADPVSNGTVVVEVTSVSEVPDSWMRARRNRIPSRAIDHDRAKFAKATDYLVRADDSLVCPNPRCRKRFDIPDYQTVVLL